MKNADYRKHNDRSLNSSTYHKKDGTSTRAILKREAAAEIDDAICTLLEHSGIKCGNCDWCKENTGEVNEREENS